jgi:hypothetical protein
MSLLKLSLLETSTGAANRIPQSVLKAPFGYWFNMQNDFAGSFNPNNINGTGNAVFASQPFMFPIQFNGVPNFTINIDYQSIDGGSGWTGNLVMCAIPCTVTQSTLGNSDGASWSIFETFPGSTLLSVNEDFNQALAVNSPSVAPLRYSFQNIISGSQLVLSGTFLFGLYVTNYAHPHAGDILAINQIMCFIPFNGGIAI